MSDLMRQLPLRELVTWIFSEYSREGTVFGIDGGHFYRPKGGKRIAIFGEKCDTPVGPAAGPHTQLAQNIVVSYLTGGRFIELKTVQILDQLEIPKPCIDVADEGFNTEWSTEFTLPMAYDEYVKGWVLLHLLDEFFQFRKTGDSSFIFNMSVGYDLDGIKSDKMQRFIHGLMDASTQELLANYRRELTEEILQDPELLRIVGDRADALRRVAASIPDRICSSLTLSTMHGCPPEEIEAICRYTLTEKRLHTFVKLNPTLLGFEEVGRLLRRIGFDYITLSREAFDHDLQYPDAVGMLTRLRELAAGEGVGFGMKLTNTLGIVNDRETLPGEEMYMSGRSLFPLTVALAAKLSKEFNGEIPISFAGGASSANMEALFDAGIRPITLATELLKPGGYTRVKDSLQLLEEKEGWDAERIDVEALERLARESILMEYTHKEWRGYDKIELGQPLPLFDCYVAPCINACAIKQDIPEYVWLVSQKRYKEALELIYERNALPSITGYICDHECQENCTRLDYEGPVKIREMKKIAVEEGWDEYRASWKFKAGSRPPVAVIGAGSAGLSAAFFLAREGFQVTVFEKLDGPGGVVQNLIPEFRIPREAILRDIQFIEDHGVKFVYGVGEELTVDSLKQQGFVRVLVAVGAEKGNSLQMQRGDERVTDALEFLAAFRKDPEVTGYGDRIVVVGCGNTAMDAARVAKRLPGVEDVTVLYRRTIREMTADREEYDDAIEEGINFNFLSHPVDHDKDVLKVEKIRLGEPDRSGRPRPEPTGEFYSIPATHVVAAIGEKVDLSLLARMGLPVNGSPPKVDPVNYTTDIPGVYLLGDARTGPSSIVRCIAEGRTVADHIIEELGLPKIEDPQPDARSTLEQIIARKPDIRSSLQESERTAFAKREGERCLECNTICNKCVEVCPNRSNIALKLRGFSDAYQILHIDAFCNECGNCTTFCPWDGRPFIDKLTIFSLAEDFENSENSGFFIDGSTGLLRLGEQVLPLQRENGAISCPDGDAQTVTPIIEVIRQVEEEHPYLLSRVVAPGEGV